MIQLFSIQQRKYQVVRYVFLFPASLYIYVLYIMLYLVNILCLNENITLHIIHNHSGDS